MALAEFRGIQQINGPFILVEAVPGWATGTWWTWWSPTDP